MGTEDMPSCDGSEIVAIANADAHAALLERRTIERLRLLYGTADDNIMLSNARLAQVVRRVVRQEMADLEQELRHQLRARVEEMRVILMELRDITASLRVSAADANAARGFPER